jgi:hypothetical protein
VMSRGLPIGVGTRNRVPGPAALALSAIAPLR